MFSNPLPACGRARVGGYPCLPGPPPQTGMGQYSLRSSLGRVTGPAPRRTRVRNTFRRGFSVAFPYSDSNSVRAGSQTMSHQGRNGRDGGPAHQAPRSCRPCAGRSLAWLAGPAVHAQEAPAAAVAAPPTWKSRRRPRSLPPAPSAPVIMSSPAAPIAIAPEGVPGAAVVGTGTPMPRRHRSGRLSSSPTCRS